MDVVWSGVNDALDWLGVHPTMQDFAKAGLLVLFALLIIVILGDIYRGEIQNTCHRIKLIAHPKKQPGLGQAMQVPHSVVSRSLDGVYSDLLLFYRYRDHRGRMTTKSLHRYRIRFKSRGQRFAEGMSADGSHGYQDDEKERLGRELPDIETRTSEIVSLSESRVDYLTALRDKQMNRAHDRFSKLSRSAWRRWLAGVRKEELTEPAFVGLVAKFHFPINPYFLLYKHPDSNVRSTAWLTALTSLFAVFMQLVFTSGPISDRLASTTSAQVDQIESDAVSQTRYSQRPQVVRGK